eukprot:3821773-Amphidinium_carterae.1
MFKETDFQSDAANTDAITNLGSTSEYYPEAKIVLPSSSCRPYADSTQAVKRRGEFIVVRPSLLSELRRY